MGEDNNYQKSLEILQLLYGRQEGRNFSRIEDFQARLVHTVVNAAVIALYAYWADHPEQENDVYLLHNGMDRNANFKIPQKTGKENSVAAAIAISKYDNKDNPNLLYFEKYLSFANSISERYTFGNNFIEPGLGRKQDSSEARLHDDDKILKGIVLVNEVLSPFFQIRIPPNGGYKSFEAAKDKLITEKNGQFSSLRDLCRVSVVYRDLSLHSYFTETLRQVSYITRVNPQYSLCSYEQKQVLQNSGFLADYIHINLTDGDILLPCEVQARCICMQRIQDITHLLYETERNLDKWLTDNGHLEESRIVTLIAEREGINPKIVLEKILPLQTANFSDLARNLNILLRKIDQKLFNESKIDPVLKKYYDGKLKSFENLIDIVVEKLGGTKKESPDLSTQPEARNVTECFHVFKHQCWEMRQLLHLCSVMSPDIDPDYQGKYVFALIDKIFYSKQGGENFTFLEKVMDDFLQEKTVHQSFYKETTSFQFKSDILIPRMLEENQR